MEGEAEMGGQVESEAMAELVVEEGMVLVVPACLPRFSVREVMVVGEGVVVAVALAGMAETVRMGAEAERSASHIRPATIPTESLRTCQEALLDKAAQEAWPGKVDSPAMVEMEVAGVAYCAAVEAQGKPEVAAILDLPEPLLGILVMLVLPAIREALNALSPAVEAASLKLNQASLMKMAIKFVLIGTMSIIGVLVGLVRRPGENMPLLIAMIYID